MAEFDPQSFVEDSDIPEIAPGSLRYTTYGPGSPDPTPADLKEFTGNNDNPLGAGDVALQPDVAKQYGLSTGDKFKYEGVTYNYADTPAEKVGNVIDIYHPASDGFNPQAFINGKEQPEQQYTVGTTGSQPVDTSSFDPHAFMASEKPAPEEPAIGSSESPIMNGFKEGLKGFSEAMGAVARRPIGVSVDQAQPFAIPTPAAPSLIPTTQGGPIPGPMPTPQSASTPYPVNAGIAQGLQQTFARFVPHTMDQFKGLAQVMGAPTDPQGFFTSAAQQGLLNAQIAQQAIKAGPFSKEAGIAYGTILPQLAMLVGGVKGAPEGAVSSQEIPGAFAGQPPPSARAITVDGPPQQVAEPTTKFSETKGGVTQRQSIGGKTPTERAGSSPAAPTTPPPIPPLPPKPPESAGPVTPQELNSVPGSGKFIRSYRIDKALGDQMEAIGASRESGGYRAELQADNMLHELSKQQEQDLGKLLVSDRLRDVNPQHPQILSDKIARAIESDPAIKKALDYYKSEVKPDIEAWRQRAGLDVSKAQTFGERGISLIPTTYEVLPATPGFASVRRLPRTTRFAKAAEGMAAQYSTNLRDVMNTSYVEAIKAARVREFYQMVKDKAITDPGQPNLPQYEDLPPALRHDITAATQPELNQAPIASNPNFGLKTKAWDLAKKFGGDLQKINTAISLTANPAAAIFHMKRVLNIAASRPPVGMGVVARLEALAPYFGPKLGTFKRVVMQDASTPQFQEILKDIMDAGGGSIRPFQKYQSNVPIIKNIQAYTHEMLFGVPKGTGMKGWDLRMRVAMEQIRRSVEGNKDPQRIREFANQMGQYGSQSSWLVHYARKLNPFAGTSFPMVGTELKGSVGGSGLQSGSVTRSMALRAETMLRGTGGTILALSAANQLLSGKWPWENAKGHEFDLNTGVKNKDGQDIYASMRFIDPMLQRAVSVASIPVLSRESAKARPDYVSAAMQGPANQLTSLVNSPLATSAVKLTGKVPYWERPYSGSGGLEWMQNPGARLTPEEKAQGKSQGVRNIKSAILGLNPITENIFGDQLKVDVPGALGYMEEPVKGFKPFGNVLSTTGEPKQGSGGGRAFSHGSRSGSTRGSSRGSRRRR